MARPALWLLVLVTCAQVCRGIPKELLYPHGPGIDTNLARDQDDAASPEITLLVPIVFYGETYNAIYVNSNGLLSFLTEIPSFFNIQFPLDYPVIAPLYTNVDTRGSGTVYYRETQDPSLLERASDAVRESFSSAADFTATSLFIATWDNVGYYNRGSDKVNTFQVVICSDGEDSYVQFLYADGGIQWIQSTGQSTGLPDARAQAGLMSGDGRLFTLRGSGTDQIQNLDKWSNIQVPGMWLFHVGLTGRGGNVIPPDLDGTGEAGKTDSCTLGKTLCHSKSHCVDHVTGFCCHCHSGYYGNGFNCLKEGIPLRVNGKVSGIVNGQEFSQLDLQSYVVTSDGRTYTAISRVQSTIGYDMQTLNVLGGVIGWLFARPLNKAANGYALTGGVFNHTADISFPLTGNDVVVRQRYLGLDVFDQLKMEAEIQGSLPTIPVGTKIQIPDYEEQYMRTEPGVMVAKSSLIYRLDGVPVDNPFTVEQTVRFSECPHAPLNVSTVRLKVARNFISYEGRENIIRYAMTDKVTLSSDFDPCKEGRSKCGEHSFCRVEGNSFSCACNQGFQHLYSESDGVGSEICVDINECQTGAHDCDVNALCINEEGSYACQCVSGFVGNGQSCQKLETCEDLNCHPDAECVQVTETALQCQCLAGFTGDGVNCVPSIGRESCDQANDCSVYGACTLDATSNKYVCVCLPGYLGDGYYCVDSELHSNYTVSGVPVPTCVLGICWCPEGYDLQGQNSCAKKYDYEDDPVTDTDNSEDSLILSRPEPACYNSTLCFCPTSYTYEPLTGTCDLPPGANSHSHGTMGPTGHKPSCNIVNTCHPHAQCVLITQDNRYRCQCDAGYEGDGYECGEIDVSCEEVDICDIHATCTYDELREKAVCLCNPGYQGDGILCSVADECSGPEDCGGNAKCDWSRERQHYACLCVEGHVREGAVCVPEQGGGCNILNNCDEHAQCLYDSESDEHRCVCDAGFTGDGNSCSVDHISCNVLNNCGPGAECVYDRSAGGHRCRCSQGFHGDGLNCLPDYSCQQDPNLCSRDASCVLGPTGAHTCVCNQGYVGDGSKCKASSKYEGNFLLVSQGMATLRIPFKPKGRDVPRPISIQYFQMAIGIDIDCLGGRVYWSDVSGGGIKSSNYDGSNVTTFLKTGGSPEGVSVDWVSRNLYWTDSSKDTLEVAGLDSQLRKTLVTEGLVNPRGVVVHPTRGKVFWSDWNREAPKLEWANQDGSGRAVFLEGPAVQLPNSLAIDFDRDELCWADAGTKSIECVGIGNLVQRTVVANCSYPFGLTISHNSYYWTDWQTQRVESAERPSGKLNKGVDVPLGGSGKLYGIVAVPEHCHRQSNVCQFDNGQCSSGHLCLPNGSGGRSCVCGENLDTEGSGEAPICNDI